MRTVKPKKRDRRDVEKAIGSLYERLQCDLGRCWYCDDARDVLDHCPPLFVAFRIGLAEIKARDIKLRLIPACNTCNLYLGAQRHGLPSERLLALYNTYQRKLEHRAQWSDDDLAELGYGLSRQFSAYAHITENLIRKLRGVERRLATLTED